MYLIWSGKVNLVWSIYKHAPEDTRGKKLRSFQICTSKKPKARAASGKTGKEDKRVSGGCEGRRQSDGFVPPTSHEHEAGSAVRERRSLQPAVGSFRTTTVEREKGWRGGALQSFLIGFRS